MSAGAWVIYNEAKQKLMNGGITLPGAFRVTLHTSASNAATATLSQYSELTNEVSEANGYSSSGKALANEAWTVGSSASQYKFDCDDFFWSANGGSIANIKFAVIWQSASSTASRKLLCRSTLTSSQFSLAAGNRMTVVLASAGVFTLA